MSIKLTESHLRSIIKEEIEKILKEADDLLSFEDWLKGQKIDLTKLKSADIKIVQDRYNKYKKNKTTPQKEPEDPNREGIRRLRSGT